MKNELSPRHRLLLRYLEDFIAFHGYSPSFREIQQVVGYNSIGSISYALSNLHNHGYIKYTPRIARSIVILGSSGNEEE